MELIGVCFLFNLTGKFVPIKSKQNSLRFRYFKKETFIIDIECIIKLMKGKALC